MTFTARPTSNAAVADHDPAAPVSGDFEEFIYLISHDVRNSVRALIELPQWISEDLAEAGVPLDGSVGESIELMNRHTGRLDRMLVDLLTFSRVGRMQAIVEVDLQQALDEVLDEIAVPAGFTVERDLSCDRFRLGERDVLTLLTALLSNAIKHNDRTVGKIAVSCRTEGAEVVLSVEDNGPGIPPKFHDRIFGAMTTLRPRDEVEGSGMGLAITRKIAQLYGGDVAILDTGSARGSTFEVRWPV
ncbi:sensor histidine kinase [Roseobacter sinensis]|uniref:histidine kinase n=1 Tax=Roseobacter sinensis TaxID=2931391 RepID=A0ABT3BBQ8_9RHOB|nr:ATP-binding protein [Roseobacter sp. WL0113]MCV3270599.1 ATP-binding protein [Roseobacter sp. WL0113]